MSILVSPIKFSVDVNQEIPSIIPTPILLLIFKEALCQLKSGNEILQMVRTTKLTCKFLDEHASNDLSSYLNKSKVNIREFVKIFNVAVEKSWRAFPDHIMDNITDGLARKLKYLLVTNKISKLLQLTETLLSEDARFYHIALEKLIAKVIDRPYCWRNRDDYMLTQLSLECAKKDALATAQLFHKIPFIFLTSGEKVGIECAKNNPLATLKCINNFKKTLFVERWGRIPTKYVDNIIETAQTELSKAN